MSQINKYRIYHRKQDVGKKIEQLHRSEQLAIGIIDVGTLEQLESSLSWYIENMNFCLHAVVSGERGDIAFLKEKYPDVTFIVFPSMPSFGESVNTIADECFTTFFMIVRSNVEIIRFEGAYLFDVLNGKEAPVGLVPVIANSSKEIIPSMRSPRLTGTLIDPDSYFPYMASTEVYQTLYPFRAMGLFDRALFQRLRGYDIEIKSEYYQCLDFGIRCNEYGYTIGSTSAFIVSFPDRLSIIEDRSPTEGLSKVHTRALGVETINGKNFAHKFRGYFDRKTFNDEVKNKSVMLVKKDFNTIIKNWKYTPDEETLRSDN
ncbi:MAG: hypothetical protein PQJ49_14410 [Sphaerochaetaceae bacterium]|nr:hypothetical protein [Sphaerochaetaceae bacterium]